ncbi:hypothetical protein O181_086343 [Austropuccinia psidii MF-1]|uniref:Uncharacterized protein n=1 Tax=Austropuccinia psidii MF-1 TaxID=1389203 RepID=A0A9Q3FZ44_9BASI|nr:hypothetical protein [Austropuccinia psidii MF-1]
MRSGYRCYGSGYSDFVKVFSDKELEELLFGYPSSPSTNMGLWSWANNFYAAPPSPPALATLSRSSSPSPSLEGNETCASPYIKALKTSPVSPKQNHHYFLRPRDSTGRAITSRQFF